MISSITWLTGWIRPISSDDGRTGKLTSVVSADSLSASDLDARAVTLVPLNRATLAVLVQLQLSFIVEDRQLHLDRNDLVLVEAALQRRAVLAVALHRELVLVLTADIVLPAHQLGGAAHVEVVVDVPEAVLDHAVNEAAVAKALTGANTTHTAAYVAEASQFQANGIPAVLCGPGNIDQAHQANEWIALDPLNNPDAPKTPFELEGATDVYMAESIVWDEIASEKFNAGKDANQNNDNWILATVMFASVLFFAGISTKFKSSRIRALSIGLATFALVGSTVLVVSLPRLIQV